MSLLHPGKQNPRVAWLHFNKSQWIAKYLLIIGILIESEVEIEYSFLKIFGEIHFLSEYRMHYLYSLTITVSRFLTLMISVYALDYSFFESGLFRMATKILGSSIFKFGKL